MKHLLLAALLALCSATIAENFKSPFKAEAPGFYFVHGGGPLKLELKLDPEGEHAAAVARIFDAEEKLVAHAYRKIPAGTSYTLAHDFGANAPKGIYQIRVSGQKILATPRALPEKPFGVMAQRCMLNATSPDQFANAFFLIPPDAKELKYRTIGGKAKLFDASGKELAGATVPVADKAGEVWRFALDLPKGDYYRFDTDGFPVILCPDEATARAIGGSIVRAADGRRYPHQFQARIHDWMKSLKRSDLELKPVDLKQFAAQIDADPAAQGLLGPWGLLTHLNDVLAEQNIDPASPDFGKVPGMSDTAAGEFLAAVYALDKPYNPYYKSPALEKRLLLPLFRHLMRLRENDGYDTDSALNYSGADALNHAGAALALETVAGTLATPETAAWLREGVQRVADRFSMFRVSCDNQSSHWPVIYECIAVAGGPAEFREMAKDYILGMSAEGGDPFMQTGYQQEAYGPDATYQGLGACYQALYYRMTGDPVAKETLRRIYTLFNHTVAPEPDGTLYGASAFSHRTRGSWVECQYGGGLQLMKGVLPEAALRFPAAPETLKALDWIGKSGRGKIYGASIIAPYYSQFRHPSATLTGGRYPAESPEPFTRNFNDEFFAVRRSSYYAVAYTGKTSADWTGASRPKTAEIKHYNNKWFQTQGMMLLSFPSYGSLATAMNWNGDTAWIVRADLPDGRMAYPDYWALEREFTDGKLRMDQTMFQLPQLNVRRTVDFGASGVTVALRLHFTEAAKLAGLYEQIPLLLNKAERKIAFRVNGQWQSEPGIADAIRFGDRVELVLDKPRRCSFGPETEFRGQKIGALRLWFDGTEFAKDAIARMQYTIQEKELVK